jgi:hypothetical protein
MVGRNGEVPEPLLASEATDFERRLLTAAANEAPSAQLSSRMAQAIGVSVGAAAATTSVATTTIAGKASASSSIAAWPWVAGGIVGLSVVGVLVGGGFSRSARQASPRVPAPVAMAPAEVPGVDPARPLPAGQNLRAEIELLDAARGALAAKASGRALELIGRYEVTFPRGSFLPEATAVRVEALVHLGRTAEARSVAQRFIAEHQGSVLSGRMAALTGLSRR